MKKFILILSSLLVITSINVFGQNSNPASCPELKDYFITQISSGSYQLTVVYDNHTGQGQKSIRTTVYDQSGNVCFMECFSALPGVNTHVSVTFACVNPSFWVFVEIFTGNTQQGCSGTACFTTLIIKLSALEARRVPAGVDVVVSWTTEVEENNLGVYVQRRIGSADWGNLGFVASKASHGNSNSPLNYEFRDANPTEEISQYRLKQVDIDGKYAFSIIRAVFGKGQTAKTTVYPNPSSDGKVTIVFEDVNTTHDIFVSNMIGQILKQHKNISDGAFEFTGLKPGMYVLRVVARETGEQTAQKIVITRN